MYSVGCQNIAKKCNVKIWHNDKTLENTWKLFKDECFKLFGTIRDCPGRICFYRLPFWLEHRSHKLPKYSIHRWQQAFQTTCLKFKLHLVEVLLTRLALRFTQFRWRTSRNCEMTLFSLSCQTATERNRNIQNLIPRIRSDSKGILCALRNNSSNMHGNENDIRLDIRYWYNNLFSVIHIMDSIMSNLTFL